MCSLETTPEARKGFADLQKIGDGGWDGRLAALADQDTTTEALGLERLLDRISNRRWRQHPVLHTVRKKRMGRHRAYIAGQNCDCAYHVCWVKINKRSEEHREEDPHFQAKVLRALCGQPVLLVEPPPDSDDG